DLTCDTGDAAPGATDGATAVTESGLVSTPDGTQAAQDASALDAAAAGDTRARAARDAGAADAFGDATSPIPIADRDATVPAPDATDSGAGTNDAGRPGADATTPDGSSPASPDAAPDSSTPPPDAGPGGVAIPAGWQVVLLSQTQGIGAATCPASFTPHALVAAATAASGACSCSCQISQAPSCTSGTLDTSKSTGECTRNAAGTLAIPSSACLPVQGTLGARFGAGTLPVQGGACSSSVQSDPTQITRTFATECDVPPALVPGVAQGSVPAGFASCISAPGTLPCPGAPFTQSQALEDDVTLSCATCSACSLSASCTGATLSIFQDTACSNLIVTVPIDGSCPNTRSSGAQVGSISYNAQVVASCAAGSSSAALTPVNPRTVCCQPAAASSGP
ncbi:MAG: hypothetical protein JOZ69_19035, partial [Myxococcales bacterium]|nr:hypothetical protein [Myxococcales bacterium]